MGGLKKKKTYGRGQSGVFATFSRVFVEKVFLGAFGRVCSFLLFQLRGCVHVSGGGGGGGGGRLRSRDLRMPKRFEVLKKTIGVFI